MLENFDYDKKIDPLNETIKGEIFPLAFSTEIKIKKAYQKKVDIDYSFDARRNTIFSDVSNKENENECYISSRYLVKHEKPPVNCSSFLIEPNSIEEKMPSRETNVDQPNSKDISQFARFSNSMNDSESIIAPHFARKYTIQDKKPYFHIPNERNDVIQENNNLNIYDDTIHMIESVETTDFNNTTLFGINELVEELDLSKTLNMTKIALEIRKATETKKTDKNEGDLSNIKDSLTKSVILLSNKSSMLWIGIPVQVPQIKSFTLNLRSSLPQDVHLSIKGKSPSFFFTDQQGKSESKFTVKTFEPKTDRKFYVCFHPKNSDYHLDRIIIFVGGQKFKINLFGYAEPAIVDLKGFFEINDPNDMNKKALMKSFVKSRGITKFTLSLFNSGARTACVGFKSVHRNVTFQPRMLLLIPKTKMDFDVTINMTGNETSIQFFMFSVDEELRRAARISVREFPSDDIYKLFNDLEIFTNLPDEKIIQQDDLPKFDWRPYLCRQMNYFYKICYLNFVDDTMSSSTFDRLTSESVTTIGMVTRSSVTGRSVLANIDCYYSKSLYTNSTDGDVHGLQQTLSSVVIHKDNNIFTPTCIKTSNYLGILIRNNNQFAVNWLISDMASVYQDSIFEKNKAEYSNGSSVFSLNSIPPYDQSKCMTVTYKNGCLQPNETTVIPVKFTSENTGMTLCRCSVKVFTENDDHLMMEKDLNFSAESVRSEHTNHPEIPNLEIDKTIEVSYRLSENKNEKCSLNILMKNKSNRNLQIYPSRLTAPFNLKCKVICLSEGKCILCVMFRLSRKGDFKEVLVLSDEAGNSTFTTLIVHVK